MSIGKKQLDLGTKGVLKGSLGARDMHSQEEKSYKVKRSPEGKLMPLLSECSYCSLPRCQHLRAGAAANSPPVCGARAGEGRLLAGSCVNRVQAAASQWQGPTAGQPTAESCQAAARRGGLASPSGRKIKG